MFRRRVSNLKMEISPIGLGTWAFGSDKWWGPQEDEKSLQVINKFVNKGFNLIDTAPAYGRGHSEEIIGEYLKQKENRKKVVVATKLGLSWEKGRVYHDLSEKRMKEEIELSLGRLNTDYMDIYQVHWPDPDTPIKETASVMREFFEEGVIKAIGVSNYSIEQMRKFMKYSPLHVLQPPFNMFNRDIEEGIIPFCIENNISIFSYSSLNSGILTGKFFFTDRGIPTDLVRRGHQDLKEPLLSVNKKVLSKLKKIATNYNKTLTQLVLNWTYNQEGITSALAGARNIPQIKENMGAVGWNIKRKNMEKIDSLLEERRNIS